MLKHNVKITKYSHYFKCTEISDPVKAEIYAFTKANIVKLDILRDQRGKEKARSYTVYGAATEDRTEFRFHINILELFTDWMKRNGINVHDFLIEEIPLPEADFVDIALQDKWNLREKQVPIVEYLSKPGRPIQRFVGIQPGGGKTLCGTAAIIAFGKRFIAIVKPMYIDKWVSDIMKISDCEREEILDITGGPQLKKFLHLCEDPEGLDNIKAVIISNSTMRVWLNMYEKFGAASVDLGYAFTPDLLYEKARAGIRLIDEVHQDFHLNFKLDLYTNVQRSISLSATLISNDPFLEKVQRIAYPMADRYNGGALNRYTAVYGVTYNVGQHRKIKTSEFNQSSYSHTAYEKSIMRDPQLFRNYAEMIHTYLELGFMRDYQKGRKAVVFASTKEMCTRLSDYFRKVYPHLDIRRYVAEDPYSNLNDPDIRFTTVLSGGTAHDIPNLTAAFLTIAIDSIQANVQIFGRLREIEGFTPRFYFFSCLDIPKHMKYHKAKVETLSSRGISFTSVPYNRSL